MGKCNFTLSLWSIIIILFSVLGCSQPQKHFDKSSFLIKCGIDLSTFVLSDSQLDSLLSQRQTIIDSIKAKRGLTLLSKVVSDTLASYFFNSDYIHCKKLFEAFCKEDLSVYGFDTARFKLIDHYFALALSKTDDSKEVIDLCLAYAIKCNSEMCTKIGEEAYSYARSINDSVSSNCAHTVVKGLSRPFFDYHTKALGKKLIKWSKIAIKDKIKANLDYSSILFTLAYTGYETKDRRADRYADSLFAYNCKNKPAYGDPERYFIVNNPIVRRYASLVSKKQYKKAEGIIDYFLNCYDIDTTAIDNSIKDFVHERVNPSDSIGKLTIRDYNRLMTLLKLIKNPFEDTSLAISIREKSRMLYYQNDISYSVWLNRLFLNIVRNTFPSMTIDDIRVFLSPNFHYSPDMIRLLTFQYNNLDPKEVYDACLYLKSGSDRIPIELYKEIKATGNKRIIQHADSIRFGYSTIASFNADEELLLDRVEMSLMALFKKNLTSWQDVKSNLGPTDVALEYLSCPSLSIPEHRLYKAAIIRQDSSTPDIIDLCDEIQLKKAIIAKNNDLYELVWKPLESYLKKGDRIIFSTDGLLNLCNIQTLESKSGAIPLDNYQLCQVSSTREIIDLNDKEVFSSISLFGGLDYKSNFQVNDSQDMLFPATEHLDRDICRGTFEYLPSTFQEVCSISSGATEVGIKSTVYSDRSGTEEAFYSLHGHSPDIIHLATHGFYFSTAEASSFTFFDQQEKTDPLERCGLVLSSGLHVWNGDPIPEGSEDGILLGSEIERIDLDGVNLVVLSACNTALGDISGDGIAGLRQAFKRAGVKSILMTLSKVDDEATSYFMTNFYEHLFSGEDKHTAYRAAINTMRNSEKYSDPKYWSSFILVD